MVVHVDWISDKGENLTAEAKDIKRIYSNDGDPNGALIIELLNVYDTNICVLTKNKKVKFRVENK